MAEPRELPILFSGPMVRAILEGKKTQTRRLLTPGTASFGSAPRLFWEHANFERAWVDGKATAPAGMSLGGGEYLHVPCHRNEIDAGPCAECDLMGWRMTSHRLWPRWRVGDRLWIKETHAFVGCDADDPGAFRGEEHRISNDDSEWFHTRYVADLNVIDWDPPTLRPSIHMPRWASRLTLEVTGVRCQRLQEISEEDAIAEGVLPVFDQFPDMSREQRLTSGELMADAPYRAAYAILWDELIDERATWKSNPWVWVIDFERLEVAHA